MRSSILFVVLWTGMSHATNLEDGARIWEGRCKGCHGGDGKAQTPIGQREKILDFSSLSWQKMFADQDIALVIREGSASNPKMKPFGERLSEDDVASVVKFIRSLAAKEPAPKKRKGRP